MSERQSSPNNPNIKFLNENKRNLKYSFTLFILEYPFLSGYVHLGAILFYYIEHCWFHPDISSKSEMEKTLSSICEELNLYNNSTRLNFTSVNETILDLNVIFGKCQSIFTGEERRCDLNKKMFFRWTEFTLTVCFTVGYGNVTPKTAVGKIATMVYAIPGIALALTTYLSLGKVLLSLTKLLIYFVEIKMLHRQKILYLNRKLIILQLLLIIIMALTQAWASTLPQTENYSFLNAVYFVFISIKTIGFGDFDYRIEKYYARPYLFVLSVVCYFGCFALIASLLSIVSEVFEDCKLVRLPEKIFRKLSKRVKTRKEFVGKSDFYKNRNFQA